MNHTQKNTLRNRRNAGLTLVEILVVVVIVAILMSILLPVLARQKVSAKAKLARLDCSTIAQAVTQYNMDNTGRYPLASPRTYPGRYSYNYSADKDLTLSIPTECFPNPGTKLHSDWKQKNRAQRTEIRNNLAVNADVAIILTALEGIGDNVVNAAHVRNPKKHKFLDSKMANSVEKSGMGPDGVYRDPFGNPYVVTLDKNGDGKCWDVLYGDRQVSGPSGDPVGAHGLMKQAHPNADIGYGYVLPAKAMVWSAGPDQEVSPGQDALKEKNYDNILGW